jgi:hypothetical protein
MPDAERDKGLGYDFHQVFLQRSRPFEGQPDQMEEHVSDHGGRQAI